MEYVIIAQSAVIACLCYYAYVTHTELRSIKAQIDWLSNEIFALKSQIKSVYFADMGAKVHAAKKKIASKLPITKPKKDKQ